MKMIESPRVLYESRPTHIRPLRPLLAFTGIRRHQPSTLHGLPNFTPRPCIVRLCLQATQPLHLLNAHRPLRVGLYEPWPIKLGSAETVAADKTDGLAQSIALMLCDTTNWLDDWTRVRGSGHRYRGRQRRRPLLSEPSLPLLPCFAISARWYRSPGAGMLPRCWRHGRRRRRSFIRQDPAPFVSGQGHLRPPLCLAV